MFVLFFYYYFAVRSAALYAGLSDRQQNGDFEAIFTGKPRLGLAEAVDKAGNNAEGNGARLQQKLFGQTASGTKLSASANLETSNKENDLPDTYVLVVVSEVFLFVPACDYKAETSGIFFSLVVGSSVFMAS